MSNPFEVHVKQLGNRVEVTADEIQIYYEIVGVDLPALTDYSFAVWHFLPYAIKKGRGIFIHGPVDSLTLENARKMALMWEMWEPKKFSYVEISASSVINNTKTTLKDGTLTFYSGGIDSTHMVLSRGVNLTRQPMITVHGMDYDLKTDHQFKNLLELSKPLEDAFNYERIVLKTNANKIARGYHAWSMALAGHAHLFSGLYGKAEFASDFSTAQDFLSFPWGSNTIANKFFSSQNFEISDRCTDFTRAMKVDEISRVPLALQSSSFCKLKKIRPKNCGRCSKCIRTKVMFVAATGQIPDIFVDPIFDNRTIKAINLWDRVERLMFIDAFQMARERGHLDKYPAIRIRFENEICGAGYFSKSLGALRSLIYPHF